MDKTIRRKIGTINLTNVNDTNINRVVIESLLREGYEIDSEIKKKNPIGYVEVDEELTIYCKEHYNIAER